MYVANINADIHSLFVFLFTISTAKKAKRYNEEIAQDLIGYCKFTAGCDCVLNK